MHDRGVFFFFLGGLFGGRDAPASVSNVQGWNWNREKEVERTVQSVDKHTAIAEHDAGCFAWSVDRQASRSQVIVA